MSHKSWNVLLTRNVFQGQTRDWPANQLEQWIKSKYPAIVVSTESLEWICVSPGVCWIWACNIFCKTLFSRRLRKVTVEKTIATGRPKVGIALLCCSKVRSYLGTSMKISSHRLVCLCIGVGVFCVFQLFKAVVTDLSLTRILVVHFFALVHRRVPTRYCRNPEKPFAVNVHPFDCRV